MLSFRSKSTLYTGCLLWQRTSRRGYLRCPATSLCCRCAGPVSSLEQSCFQFVSCFSLFLCLLDFDQYLPDQNYLFLALQHPLPRFLEQFLFGFFRLNNGKSNRAFVTSGSLNIRRGLESSLAFSRLLKHEKASLSLKRLKIYSNRK